MTMTPGFAPTTPTVRSPTHALVLLLALVYPSLGWPRAPICPPVSSWTQASSSPAPLSAQEVMGDAAAHDVVLLGEEHDNAQHHAWQLHTLAALHSRRPRMKIAFEGFPRAVQPVLDRWIAGEFSEAEFLHAVDWDRNWGYDAQLYLPIFHFARIHALPLIAMNVDRSLVRRVSSDGWASVPPADREGVGDPALAPQAYRDILLRAYGAHQRSAAGPEADEAAFARFVESMLLWDRAMAEAIAKALSADALVVGIAGKGHLEFRHGIARQLADLGIHKVAVLLPQDSAADCPAPTAGIADAVFTLPPPLKETPSPRLGVELALSGEGSTGRVRIERVVDHSVAQAAGLRAGDIIEVIAGVNVRDVHSVIATVKRQAPGTWLPIRVQREGQSLDLVAKFPPTS